MAEHKKRTRYRTPKATWEKFLKWLSKTGNLEFSAAKSKIGRRTVYERIENDENFAARVEDARKLAASLLEEEARRRAHDGVREPVFYKGVICGHVRKYSDGLLHTLLRANDPERFVDRSKLLHGSDPDNPLPTATIITFGGNDPAIPQPIQERMTGTNGHLTNGK